MSFAAKFLRFCYWLVWFVTRPWRFNVASQRMGLELALGIFPRVRQTKYLAEIIADVPGEWIIPEWAGENKVLFYLHGGAYAIGSIKTHRRLVANLAKACHMKALAIEYSLAPEAIYPVALNQVVAVYRKLLDKGFKPSNIVIAGDSAGGGLAISAMLKLRDTGIPLPGLAVLLAPWTDVEGTGISNTSANQHNPINNEVLIYFGKLYAGENNIRGPFISPMYADLTGLPPMYIQVSTSELIYNDSTRFADNARKANVEVTVDAWDNMEHVWQLFDALLPESRKAIKKAGDFVREKMKVPLIQVADKK